MNICLNMGQKDRGSRLPNKMLLLNPVAEITGTAIRANKEISEG